MSKRYEFLEDGAELLAGPDLTELDLGETWLALDGHYDADTCALVLGNPWATAGVLVGTRAAIAATLREWLALVEPDEPAPGPRRRGYR